MYAISRTENKLHNLLFSKFIFINNIIYYSINIKINYTIINNFILNLKLIVKNSVHSKSYL